MKTHPVTGEPHPQGYGKVPAEWVLQPDNGTHVGWCEADPERVLKREVQLLFHCGCLLDGSFGQLCERPAPHTCLNQCGSHGACNRGLCTCDEGWTGPDCSGEAREQRGSGSGLAHRIQVWLSHRQSLSAPRYLVPCQVCLKWAIARMGIHSLR